jgi:hypothetical protein
MKDFEVFSGEALFFLATALNGEWVILDAERSIEDLQALADLLNEKTRQIRQECADICLYGDIAKHILQIDFLGPDYERDPEEWVRQHCAAAILGEK